MMASAVIRFLVTYFLVVFLASQAVAQTNPANPPQPPASGASSSRSAQASPPPLAPDGFIHEPLFLSNGIDFMLDKFGDGNGEPKSGFYPEVSNMITGAGWVSIGPGYRQYLNDRHVLLDTSAAVSWRFYKMVQGRAEVYPFGEDRLTLGAQAMWQDQTQVNYFGIGSGATDVDQTQYRLQSLDLVGYGTLQANDWLTFDGTLGYLPSPKLLSPGGTFNEDFPFSRIVFPTDPAMSLAKQPDFLHSTVSVTADTRDYHGHPTSGGRYRAALTTFSDRTDDIFSFRQYEAEATHFIPLADRRWVLAFRGWTVFSDVGPGHDVPFYLLPSLGGHNTLRDFHNFEFHDRNSLVVNGESRWAIFTHVDAAVFFDAGNVAPRYEDLNLDKTSYGAGLRVHIERATIARLDVAQGPAGWNVVFRTSDPLRLSRGRRHVVHIPFTP
jgi:surface antigen Omp85-like protein